MASVNRVQIIGNLGRDPDVKTFPSGDQVANLVIATTDRWKDKNTGEQKESTEWHRVTLHGKTAGVAERFLKKGSQIYIEGSLRTRKWTDQASGQERYATEIRADSMQMLGGKSEGSQQDQGYGGNSSQRQAAPQRQPAPQQRASSGFGSGFDDDSSDIPF